MNDASSWFALALLNLAIVSLGYNIVDAIDRNTDRCAEVAK